MSYSIYKYQVAQVPKLPEHGLNFSSQDVYAYYQKQSKNYEIESFTGKTFENTFKGFSKTQEQYDTLQVKAKEINRLAQSLFDVKVKK